MTNYHIEAALTISEVADKEISLPLSWLLACQHRPISGWFAIRWSRIITYPVYSYTLVFLIPEHGNLTSLTPLSKAGIQFQHSFLLTRSTTIAT